METVESGNTQDEQYTREAIPVIVPGLRLLGGAAVGIGVAVGVVFAIGGGASGAAVAATGGVLTLVLWRRNQRTASRRQG